jgi:hypothetical protein
MKGIQLLKTGFDNKLHTHLKSTGIINNKFRTQETLKKKE